MKRLICTILCVFILLCACAEDIPVSSLSDDGMLRVELRSLGTPAELTLSVTGPYTVGADDGIRIMPNAEFSVIASEGSVWLTVGGVAYDAGATLTLVRRSDEDGEAGGLRIAESRVPENLFCGDLVLYADNGGLRAVLNIDIEEYLCGVIAYEMSDAWPLEALKAQAVAARTYALRRKAASQNDDHDLVDTTADQVFKGCDPSYENVRTAVESTKGIVGTVNSELACCYYTASNGGQIGTVEEVWGREGDGAILRADDPYDPENPYSVTKHAELTPDLSGYPQLLARLIEEAGDDLEDLTLTDVEAVEPKTEGSRMFTAVRFRFTACRTLSWEEKLKRLISGLPLKSEPEGFDVTLPFYSELKEMLELGINRGDYETLDVRNENGLFVLETARFGHGVGMSQRGAQRMAGVYDKTWIEILNFYYAGMTLEYVDMTPAVPAVVTSVGAPVPASTPVPTPSPAPLPEPGNGEHRAVVTLESSASTMNVRAEPSTAAAIVTVVPNGRELLVCSETDENGWVKVRTVEFSGFVMEQYLTISD